jgi:protein-S-isoprenylcysteine O-methyltransferase Ste14
MLVNKEIAMRRLLSFLYGLIAYAAALAILLYLIGFSAGVLVPKSVDSGAASPAIDAIATDLLLLALFGVQHSVMARSGFKRWWTRIVPPALERSTYVLATCAVLALMFWLWVPIAAPVVWRVERGADAMLLWSLFGLGWSLALFSTFLIDHFELFGLRQAFARLTLRPMAEALFETPLLYRHVRHPLYAGLMLGLWAVPVMTAGRLLFALGLSAYILIGIAFEERDLLRRFGERYSVYREQVGMLVPRLRRARRTARDGSGPADPCPPSPGA